MWQVRLAGLSGAASIGLGAVGAINISIDKSDPDPPTVIEGAHKLKGVEEYRNIWKTAVQYHQFGTVSLLACSVVPSPRARMVGSVGLSLGMS